MVNKSARRIKENKKEKVPQKNTYFPRTLSSNTKTTPTSTFTDTPFEGAQTKNRSPVRGKRAVSCPRTTSNSSRLFALLIISFLK